MLFRLDGIVESAVNCLLSLRNRIIFGVSRLLFLVCNKRMHRLILYMLDGLLPHLILVVHHVLLLLQLVLLKVLELHESYLILFIEVSLLPLYQIKQLVLVVLVLKL
jgi:hypothetical protein